MGRSVSCRARPNDVSSHLNRDIEGPGDDYVALSSAADQAAGDSDLGNVGLRPRDRSLM